MSNEKLTESEIELLRGMIEVQNQAEQSDRLDCLCYKLFYSMGRLRNK
jgi:hypothetical protein